MLLVAQGNSSGEAIVLTNEEKVIAVREGRYDINQLMLDNEGLIKNRAYKYAQRVNLKHHEFEDMLQAARVGMFNAINNYEVGQKAKLSTYAVICIDGEMKNFFNREILVDREMADCDELENINLANSEPSITLTTIDKATGRNYSTQGLKISKRQEEILMKYFEGYTLEEIAKDYGTTKQTVFVHLQKAQSEMRKKYNYCH